MSNTLCEDSVYNVLLDRYCTFKCINCLQYIDVATEDFELKEYTLCTICEHRYDFKKCSEPNCNNNYLTINMTNKCHVHSKVVFSDNTEVLKFIMDVVQNISTKLNQSSKKIHNSKNKLFVPITKDSINKHNKIIDDNNDNDNDNDNEPYKITFNDIVHIPDPIGEVIMNEDPSKYTCSGFTSTKANAACTKKAKSFNKMGKPVCGFHRDK